MMAVRFDGYEPVFHKNALRYLGTCGGATAARLKEAVVQIAEGKIEAIPSPLTLGKHLVYAFAIGHQITISVDEDRERLVVVDIMRSSELP